MQKKLLLKIISIFAIAMILLLAIELIKSTLKERESYKKQAYNSVSESWTGPQHIITPVLMLPYQQAVQTTAGFTTTSSTGKIKVNKKFKVIIPNILKTDITVENSNVYRGIYEVPVYSSNLKLIGEITKHDLDNAISDLKNRPDFVHFETPYLAFHIADMRGINSTPSLIVNKQRKILEPGSNIHGLGSGLHASLESILQEPTSLNFDIEFMLRGMEQLSFIPMANDAKLAIDSNWPHPSFVGSSLPDSREINSEGFTASWSSNRYSNSRESLLNQCITQDDCYEILYSGSGVRFIENVDIYLQSERSVKYAILFIGLSFITFFIMENLKKIRIHPIQYTFVGLAISIFYLLLIALTEHIAFEWAYAIAVTFCSGLLMFYLCYMLRSTVFSLMFSLMIVGLYGLLYVIIQAEDFAMLMGAGLVFIILTVLMTITRNFDWYSLSEIKMDKESPNRKSLNTELTSSQ